MRSTIASSKGRAAICMDSGNPPGPKPLQSARQGSRATFQGLVSGGAAIAALVDDINIKRKAAYTREASVSGATVEQFAFTTGCRLIANTKGGEKYQAPDGSWQTRGGGAPIRDSRCP